MTGRNSESAEVRPSRTLGSRMALTCDSPLKMLRLKKRTVRTNMMKEVDKVAV